MLHDIFSLSNRSCYNIVREDPVRYSIEKSSKKKLKIKIKFGAEVAEKAKIFKGGKLKIVWDDENKHLLISRSELGFTVQYPKNQKRFIVLNLPGKVEMPMISKTFTNFHSSAYQIILDFSLVEEKTTTD